MILFCQKLNSLYLLKEKVFLINNFYIKNFDYKPRIAVLGLNPHCESIENYNEDENIIRLLKALEKDVSFNFRVLICYDNKSDKTLSHLKGNKIINIPTPKFVAKEEFMAHAQLLSPVSSLRIESGKRFLTLKLKDLENYISSRAKRGNMLPQGYRKVDRMIEEVETISSEEQE